MTIIPYSVNRRDTWDEFVMKTKQGNFMLQRGYMDCHADKCFDCSLLIYQGISPDDEYKESMVGLRDLVAVFPANWVESEKKVLSHGSLMFGGLLTIESMTQTEVNEIMARIMMYYRSYYGAEHMEYTPVPYIFTTLPSQEDLSALYLAGAKLMKRRVITAVEMHHPLKMRLQRARGVRKAVDEGCYIERVLASDTVSMRTFWELLGQYREEESMAPAEHSLEDIAKLMEIFPHKIRIYVVKKDEKIVAGNVMFETRYVAHTQYSAVTHEGKELCAMDLLMSHLLNTRYKDKDYVDAGEEYGGRAVCYDTYSVMLSDERICLRLAPKLRTS